MNTPRRTSSKSRSAAGLAALCAASLAAASPAAAADPVIARAGAIEVTVEEVRAHVATLGAQEQAALAKDPSLLSQAVRVYLARRAVLAEARGKGWDQDPAVKAQLDRVRDQAATELYLEAISRPPDAYPSDAEVQAAYDANRSAFAVPAQWRVAQIFVAAARNAEPEAEKRARARVDELVKKLSKRGADFAAVARAETDEKGSAERGGDLGWVTEEQLVPAIRQVVTKLPKDGVSEPVRMDDGWHVLKVVDVRPAGTRPLQEVRDALVSRLRAERAQATRQAHLARLLEKSPPAVDELALSRALAKP
jgi:parvulin-like peptidyl-prolyl isomerase